MSETRVVQFYKLTSQDCHLGPSILFGVVTHWLRASFTLSFQPVWLYSLALYVLNNNTGSLL